MLKKIFFAAGGTGGHIYPAIAVADEIKIKFPETEIVFTGAKGRIEEKIIPSAGYELITLDIEGFKREFNLKNIKILLKAFKSLSRAKQILKQHRPELVFGTGGFASGPVIKAAQSYGIRTVIMEGNYYPGLTTRLLASRADKVILNFRESEVFFRRKDNIEFIAYPVRRTLRRIPRSEALDCFGLNQMKKTLLIIGGSQGARAINSAVLRNYNNLIDSGLQIIWQTGIADYDAVTDSINSSDIKIYRYIENVDMAYSACDLSLCRSGISTISELAALAIPSVLVPFPASSGSHQLKNADVLVKNEAAIMCEESNLDNFLKHEIMKVINDELLLKKLRDNISKFADIDAAKKIAMLLESFDNKSVS